MLVGLQSARPVWGLYVSVKPNILSACCDHDDHDGDDGEEAQKLNPSEDADSSCGTESDLKLLGN